MNQEHLIHTSSGKRCHWTLKNVTGQKTSRTSVRRYFGQNKCLVKDTGAMCFWLSY
jgi:hypothetical protein